MFIVQIQQCHLMYAELPRQIKNYLETISAANFNF